MFDDHNFFSYKYLDEIKKKKIICLGMKINQTGRSNFVIIFIYLIFFYVSYKLFQQTEFSSHAHVSRYAHTGYTHM